MKKYIHIQRADREAIMKAFGVTERTVFNAIRLDGEKKESELTRRIRQMAMQRGGIVMVLCKEIECLFDADGYMRQYFLNGALMEISKDTGIVDIYHDGENVLHTGPILTDAIKELQHFAQSLK